MLASCSQSPGAGSLNDSPEAYVPEPGATIPAPPTDLGTSDQDVWEAGLLAWRTPREAINAACVNCHAPDAFDLVMLDFKDKDIRRRAQGDGLSPEQVDAIVSICFEIIHP